MTATPFTVTFFFNRDARHKDEKQFTLLTLRDHIQGGQAYHKNDLEWIKLAHFGQLRSDKGSLRNNANVEWVTGCEVDYDGEQMSFDEAVAKIRWANIACIAYTSPSHMPSAPRWRLLFPFSTRLKPDQRAPMVARANGVLDGVIGAESFTLSQSDFYGRVIDADGNTIARKKNGSGVEEVSGGEYCVELIEGRPLDLCDELDAGAIGKSGHRKDDSGNGLAGDYTDYVEMQELTRRILTGESLRPSVRSIAGKYARNDWPIETCIELIGTAFTAANQPRYGGRWDGEREAIHWVYAREVEKRKQQQPPLAVINPVQWQNKPTPTRPWVVPEWIPGGYVTGMYGTGGEGKTTLVQQLQTSCAIDRPWIGLTITRMRSIGVYCEDGEDDLHIRQAAINNSYGCEFGDLENMKMLARLGHDNMLMTFDRGKGTLTGFWEELRDAAKNFGAELMIIDTVADTFAGSELDRAQVRQYVQVALDGLARALGRTGTVLATAHPSLSGIQSGSGSSGSTGWDATFRARAYLRTPEDATDPNLRELLRVKANYARRRDILTLVWKDNVFLNAKAASYIPDPELCTEVYLNLLFRITQIEKRPVSPKKKASNYAPTLFAIRPERQGYKKRDFELAQEELFATGRIYRAEYTGLDRQKYECILSNENGNSREGDYDTF
jgi:RecA-family ATPase